MKTRALSKEAEIKDFSAHMLLRAANSMRSSSEVIKSRQWVRWLQIDYSLENNSAVSDTNMLASSCDSCPGEASAPDGKINFLRAQLNFKWTDGNWSSEIRE
jgi:hypothetical protein